MFAKLKNRNIFVPLSEIPNSTKIEPQLFLFKPDKVEPTLVYLNKEVLIASKTLWNNIFSTHTGSVLFFKEGKFKKINSFYGYC